MAKVFIITGASRGIGLAIAEYLLKAQLNVVVVARSAAPLQELASRSPNQIEAIAGDLEDYGTAKRATDAAISRWGRLDGLVLNHGVLEPVTRVANSTGLEWEKGFKIKEALPHLRKAKGRIVLTSSGAAVGNYATWGAYGASKAALNHLGATVASEEPDVTTISIRPGVVDTQMQQELRDEHLTKMNPEDGAKFATLKKDGQLLKPEQPGNVMARLVMDATNDLSGKFLSWDDESLSTYQ
ncbi:MAG: hypothetical protein M4579_001875 [Chaenotheca gracillima]|nr:MAG: hypothetical protein M4579_001875 [Chaenotheca gracillima]